MTVLYGIDDQGESDLIGGPGTRLGWAGVAAQYIELDIADEKL